MKQIDRDSTPIWDAMQILESRISQLEEALKESAKDWTFIHNELGLCIESLQSSVKKLNDEKTTTNAGS
tara:strand:- start:2478 stop:2684 length:207 start_codon:yes stop_codon:yes gene_type:complete